MKVAGILALLGGLTTLILGCFIFGEGFDGARWAVSGTPVPDTLDPLIPLLYEIGAALCGIAGGIVLLISRGRAVPVACASLILAGLALIIPRNIYSHPIFGPLAQDYARYGSVLILVGLVGLTLPGVIGAVAFVRLRIAGRRRRVATA
jgi:hypothetical protein